MSPKTIAEQEQEAFRSQGQGQIAMSTWHEVQECKVVLAARRGMSEERQ